MISLSVMNTYTLCALGAALAVPALVQPAMAEEAATPAEEFMTTSLELMGLIGEIYKAIDTDEATPDEAGEVLASVVDGLQQLQGKLAEMSPEDIAELEAIMADPEIAADLKKIDEQIDVMMNNLKAADYLESATLKAACEAYMAL